jgi:cysteine-rich repeat protein
MNIATRRIAPLAALALLMACSSTDGEGVGASDSAGAANDASGGGLFDGGFALPDGVGQDADANTAGDDGATADGTPPKDVCGPDACEDTPPGSEDVPTTGQDVPPEDCPGADGCACAENSDCFSGLCADTPAGGQCAAPCVDACPDAAQICKTMDIGAGDIASYCLPRWPRLCDPCEASAQCTALGVPDGACVDHGAAGAFCGAGCGDDSDCPTGFRCAQATSVEGAPTSECVPEGDEAGLYGACTCSPAAQAEGLATSCAAVVALPDGATATCPGTRVCGEAGLGPCSAPPPSAEVCDGVDNDCDGQTDNLACDDDNVCTTDSCKPGAGGGCVFEPVSAGTPCTEDGNACTLDACDANGACKHPATGDGAPCDADGTVCTSGDACTSGICVPGKVLACDDDDPCTTDSCDPQTGCVHTFSPDTPCDDGNPCTVGDLCGVADSGDEACLAGTPKACASGQPCVVGSCDANTGDCKFNDTPDGVPCDDGIACTSADACASGLCAGGSIDCDDANACTADSCDNATGQCVHAPVSGACTDGDACTVGDGCSAGACVAGPTKACNDGKACTFDTCDKASGACSFDANALEGSLCDADGSVCTAGDKCTAGVCTTGPQLPCQDGNPCTTNGCDPVAGCTTVANNEACDDGNACTANDACSGGDCEGTPVLCDDGNVCTLDSCDKAAGCVTTPNALPCNDGNACTAGDTCDGQGSCVGQPVACDDGNLCTDDLCEPASGCAATPNAAPCPDNEPCTINEVCAGGVCTSDVDPCDDDNPCTADLCVNGQGCTNDPVADDSGCDASGLKWCQQGVCVDKATCGNGLVDQASEQCDDGNNVSGDGCDAACQLESSCVKLGQDVRTLDQPPENWELGYCKSNCEDSFKTIPNGWHIATASEVQFLVQYIAFGSCGGWGVASENPKKMTGYWYKPNGSQLSTVTGENFTCTTGGCQAKAPFCVTQVVLIKDGRDGTCVAN